MMKEEFEKLVTRPFTASEYKEIEYVYNYHPSIENKAQSGQNLQSWKLPIRISRTASAIANAAQLVYTKHGGECNEQ